MIGISARIDGSGDENEGLGDIKTEFRKFLKRVSGELENARLEPDPNQLTLAREKIGDTTYCLVQVSSKTKKDLTDQQKKISLLVAEGLSNEGIARRLDIRPSTVAAHIARIYSKLDIDSRVALTRYTMLIDSPNQSENSPAENAAQRSPSKTQPVSSKK